jgi:putative membrane protein
MAESLKDHLRSFINGVVTGIASILPGVSGGLILVLCGSYERLIEDISELRQKIRPEFFFLVAIASGLLVGMLACTLFLDWTLDRFAAPMMAFFFGLIVAQIPEVWKLTGYEKGSKMSVASIVCLAVGLGIIIALMVVNGGGRVVDTDDHSIGNMVLFALCGIVLAVSKVMPGISGSSLLIALGLFEVTISSVAHLDIYFIAPLCVGLLIGLFGFAKVMDMCLKRFRTETYMLIMGLTIGSLMIIIQELVNDSMDAAGWAVCIVMAVLGVIGSYAFTLYGRKASA